MRRLIPVLLVVALTACGGGDAPRPAQPMPASQQDATARIGDVTARATVLQTSALDASVARGYGIERSDATALLLVGLRRGEAADTSVPARVTATVSDLRGGSRPVALRELRSGDLLDYVGVVDVVPPDTLRFDVRITVDGATSDLRFTREIHPR